MASSWGGVVSEQADLIATRLRQLVSSGLHFLHDELGIDLGLKPDLYPAWVFLSAALIGLLLLLLLVLTAACGGARRRKPGAARSKNTAAVISTESTKPAPVKAPRPEEPKKKNKKKSSEKKNQSNGGKAPDPREQVTKPAKEIPKPAAAAPQPQAAPPPRAAAPSQAVTPPPRAAAPPPRAAAPPPRAAAPPPRAAAPPPRAAAPPPRAAAPPPRAAAPPPRAAAPPPRAAAPPPRAAAPPPRAAAPQAAAPPPQAAAPPPPQALDAKAEKAKKSKKKPKPEVKPTQAVSSTDGKEPDEGAWETKISNREKRQQRKKEKGPNDESGSPGGGQQTEHPAVPAPVITKKNKESLNVKAAKVDVSVTPVQSTWNNVSSVNTGGWTDIPMKLTAQASVSDREKSSAGIKTSGHKASAPMAWAQESEAGSWTSMDGRIKPEVNRMNRSVPRLNPSAASVPVTQAAAELGNGHTNADEWSGFNGLGAADPNSDWNAPTELWGNYPETKPETPVAQETPVSQGSDDDKDKGDPSGNGKSKRKKKKKKKAEEENAGSQVTTGGSSGPGESGFVKPHPHVPVEEPTKQTIAPQSGQKKSDPNLEPLKQVQKKKARRET